ncbi:S8 family serine peptidase [Alcaligenes faecalis]|uniref:S8 family serine peptidase n=1 Tax=Alcaligenes TaxID=507 RepID=UPI00203E5998|nr:S8 family serine peptidase [Alcaligenes faecalis]MCM2558015.1 S8 family serine peptidase [Alcaligenes faecalis]MCM2620952.1 S8 family serine peptidase [Alcaligenes faecalis]MDK7587834.1 S8 family serine peptidase [Alcaligenes phenolicus]
MANEKKPVLNPVLIFKRDPRRNTVTGRGLSESQVRTDRLSAQRQVLSNQVSSLNNKQNKIHADRILVSVGMFDDSLAPTFEPDSVFTEKMGAKLVAPVKNGYLAQINIKSIGKIEKLIKEDSKVDVRVAISRIEKIEPITESNILGGRLEEDVWNSAMDLDGGKIFSIWLSPYVEDVSRDSVVDNLKDLEKEEHIFSVNSLVSVTREPGSDADQLQIQTSPSANSFSRVVRDYRQNPFARAYFRIPNQSSLKKVVASGSVFKIEPVRPLVATELPTAPDPERPILNEPWQPIVGIADGGLFAASYNSMVAWRAPSLVSDVNANRVHGNTVSSLVIQGGAWNTHLDLPNLICRIGVAQSIAKNNQGAASRVAFKSYLREVISRHHADTKVWNFSFNEPVHGYEPLEMSELGHEIHKIAREFNVLPVISIGNVDQNNSIRLNPPADCEAALTVGGRLAAGRIPGDECPDCLPGPGPEGLTKPELSWFSTLRAIGGNSDTGSSYAAAITSAIAAHTFHNLKKPSPDLVRALLINTAERDSYDSRIGWGAPYKNNALPWECKNGSVTLVWSDELRAGEWYYWEDIPIPPEFIRQGKLCGKADLTAILNPLVSELGFSNYFSTRLQVALQYQDKHGDWKNLIGSMQISSEDDADGRVDNSKWNPIRHHSVSIKRGKSFSGGNMRVCARIFGRDLYQFGFKNNSEIPPSSVAFALTITSSFEDGNEASIYDSVVRGLGNYVESAVNDIEIDVSL